MIKHRPQWNRRLGLVMAGGILAFVIACAVPNAPMLTDTPSQGVHPRLMFSAEDLPELHAQKDTTHKAF
ncbi:MAG: hypothetical protein GY847_35105 [Proteobacteria bacterium]|nr:hypothetical protein [Pseudomonadota bacterium]